MHKADNLTNFVCRNLWGLNLLEPSGPAKGLYRDCFIFYPLYRSLCGYESRSARLQRTENVAFKWVRNPNRLDCSLSVYWLRHAGLYRTSTTNGPDSMFNDIWSTASESTTKTTKHFLHTVYIGLRQTKTGKDLEGRQRSTDMHTCHDVTLPPAGYHITAVKTNTLRRLQKKMA